MIFSRMKRGFEVKQKNIFLNLTSALVQTLKQTDTTFNFEYVPKTFIQRDLKLGKVTGIDDLNAGFTKRDYFGNSSNLLSINQFIVTN